MPTESTGSLKRKRSQDSEVTNKLEGNSSNVPVVAADTDIDITTVMASTSVLKSESSENLLSSTPSPQQASTIKEYDVQSTKYPDLPRITGDVILEAYTHKSLRIQASCATDQFPDNERLSVLGEMALKLAVTNSLYNTKPLEALEMPAVRDAILSDNNIEKWVLHYNLRQKIRYAPPTDITSPEETRSLFYAYVGALYTQSGMRSVGTWISLLLRPDNPPNNPDEIMHHPAPALPPPQRNVKQLKHSKSEKRLRSEPSENALKLNGIGDTSTTGIASATYSTPPPPPSLPPPEGGFPPALTMGAGTYSSPAVAYSQPTPPSYNVAYPSPQVISQPQSAGKTQYLASFNQKCAQQRLSVEYLAENQGLPHAPKWVVHCVVNGVNKGQGQGRSKQEAKEEAARQAFYGMGWMGYTF